MKKYGIITVATLVIIIGFYFIWWNLPLTINRKSDIKLGEEIIKNIEKYKKTNGLPDNNDWETLRKFGFRDKIDFLQPEYSRIDSVTFELIYIEGFDGPYLMWNSKERVWKEGDPTFPK
ncbi:MAG: hypothetical protein ACOYO1_18610 [Bacteroidales bacterium]